ncbi:MAG: hypothetical protein ACK55I_34625, partial [bacterium]
AFLPVKDGEPAVDDHSQGDNSHERDGDGEEENGQRVIGGGFEVAVGGVARELEVLPDGPRVVETMNGFLAPDFAEECFFAVDRDTEEMEAGQFLEEGSRVVFGRIGQD